jgi:uncharacterized membrane protein YhfC
MLLLSIGIVIGILVTAVLPVGAGFWLTKKFGVTWRVLSYGALAFLLVQAGTAILFSGFGSLIANGTLTLEDPALTIVQVTLSVVLGALLGVLIRWLGMKYIKEDLTNLESAFGIGIGYGGMESIMLVGLPLISTFVTMISNLNLDPATTSLEPDMIARLEELWQVPFYIPMIGAVERLAAMVMHLTVTILILQVFVKKNNWFLAAAFGDELLINGLVVGLSTAGLAYGWVILIAVMLMAGNIFLLYKLNAFNLKPPVTEIAEVEQSE